MPAPGETPPWRWLQLFILFQGAWTSAGQLLDRSTWDAKGRDSPFFQMGRGVARLGQGPRLLPPSLRWSHVSRVGPEERWRRV